MQLIERIEKRRFVGREFLLWLWFESELFDATLSTKAHGEFGLWIEKRLVLSAGKETTHIKGATPAASREAKEALLQGKLPESAGIHVSRADNEQSFSIKADTLGISALSLTTVLDTEEADPNELVSILGPAPSPVRKKKRTSPDGEERDADDGHEAFYERMHLTREFEAILEALYRDFLALRLAPAWEETVVPAMRTWVQGAIPVETRPTLPDADAYREARSAALAGRPPKKGASKK